MHFKDDPISDMHAKKYLIILCLKRFPGPTKFGSVFWSRLFRRGPVEYNYPIKSFFPSIYTKSRHDAKERFLRMDTTRQESYKFLIAFQACSILFCFNRQFFLNS